MSDQVRISSIDALEAFRADLIQYTEKARVALEDAASQVRRTRSWLDVDRTGYWTGQCKHRTKLLDQAEAELYNATLTRPQESHAFQKMAVVKARRKLDEAGEKLRSVVHWRQVFENRTTPLLRQLDPMFFQVGRQLPQGIHSLGEAIKALQAYAESSPQSTSAPPNTVSLAPSDWGTGILPVREDSASRLTANEATGWKPVGQDRQDACPPAEPTVLAEPPVPDIQPPAPGGSA